MKKQPRKYSKNSINQSLAKATGYYDRFIVGYNKFIKERRRRRGSFRSVSPFDRQKNGSNELISEQPVEMHPSAFLQPRHVRPGAVDKGDLPGFLGYLEEGGEARVAAAAVNRDPNLSSRGREKRPRVYEGWG